MKPTYPDTPEKRLALEAVERQAIWVKLKARELHAAVSDVLRQESYLVAQQSVREAADTLAHATSNLWSLRGNADQLAWTNEIDRAQKKGYESV